MWCQEYSYKVTLYISAKQRTLFRLFTYISVANWDASCLPFNMILVAFREHFCVWDLDYESD